MELSDGNSFSSNPNASNYDILAASPLNEKMLLAACSNMDIDIICFDFESKIPFHLKHSVLGVAVKRGIYFEIPYSSSLHGTNWFILDSSIRRNWILNCHNLIRATRGKNIIISSKCERVMDLRGPSDLMNMMTFLGLKQDEAKKCVSDHPQQVIKKAALRKHSYRGAIMHNLPGNSLKDEIMNDFISV